MAGCNYLRIGYKAVQQYMLSEQNCLDAICYLKDRADFDAEHFYCYQKGGKGGKRPSTACMGVANDVTTDVAVVTHDRSLGYT